jgi:hypothetical protein
MQERVQGRKTDSKYEAEARQIQKKCEIMGRNSQ